MVASQVLGHNLIVPQSDGEKDQRPLFSMLPPTVPVHLLWPLLIPLVCLSIYLLESSRKLYGLLRSAECGPSPPSDFGGGF